MSDPTAIPRFRWSRDETRAAGERVAALVAEYLDRLPTRPVFAPVPTADVQALRAAPLPWHGEPIAATLDAFARDVAPHPFGNGHPRFSAWVNSPPNVAGVLAESLAAAMNPSVAGGNHAAVHLEHEVLRWLKQLLGVDEAAGALLVSGTSAAAIVALGVARHVVCRARGWPLREHGLQPDGERTPPRLAVYATAEAHGCHRKAVELLGIGSAHVRTVPVDDALRMDAAALDALLAADAAAGTVPMAVIASAGTVNTGAIDPLDAVADVCARHGVWLHVDGAYGGVAVLLPEYRDALGALGRADSLAVDPHKWLYVPVDAGLVVVRDAAAMRDAYSLVPPYLRVDGDEAGVQGPPWFSEFGIEQTRPFRALKIWMSLRHFGVEGYRALLAGDVARARRLAQRIREAPDLELCEPQSLSIVCFRVVPRELSDDAAALDALNRAVLRRVQLGGDAFPSGTVVRGAFWLRSCIVNPTTTDADCDALLDAVRRAAAEELAAR